MITLETTAKFTWSFHHLFFLETDEGNFVWSDPEYPGGDHTIIPFNGTYSDWCDAEDIPYGRDKGIHEIGSYCGQDVRLPNG